MHKKLRQDIKETPKRLIKPKHEDTPTCSAKHLILTARQVNDHPARESYGSKSFRQPRDRPDELAV